MTPNRVVAYNLARIRRDLGLTQEQAATRLAPYVGTLWSKATYSAAERSYASDRVRQFTPDDLVAFCFAFDVPVAYFFLPPATDDRDGEGDGLQVGERETSWQDYLADVALGAGGSWKDRVVPRLAELPAHEVPAPEAQVGQFNALLAVRLQAELGIDPATMAGNLEDLAGWLRRAQHDLTEVIGRTGGADEHSGEEEHAAPPSKPRRRKASKGKS